MLSKACYLLLALIVPCVDRIIRCPHLVDGVLIPSKVPVYRESPRSLGEPLGQLSFKLYANYSDTMCFVLRFVVLLFRCCDIVS